MAIELGEFRKLKEQSDTDLHIWMDKWATPHRHDYYEFAICNEGTLTHYLNDNPPQKVRKKQVFFITPDDVHSIEAGQGATHINVAFLPKVYFNLCEFFGASLNKDIFKNHMTTLTDREFLLIVKKVHQAFQCINDPNTHKIATYNLLAELFYIFLQRTNNNLEEDKKPAWLIDFVDKVCEPSYYELPISELYNISGYSQPIVTQAFKKYYHMSFVQYFTQKKIDYACSLLKNSNLSVLDISNMIGFSSLSHFNSVFKSIVGMTPMKFRKNNY